MTIESIKHVSADVAQSTYDVWKQIADEANNGSMADALRDSIALMKWFRGVQAQGGKILVEHNGKIREVLKV